MDKLIGSALPSGKAARPWLCLMLPLMFWGCGKSQDPSFTEQRSTTQVELRVNGQGADTTGTDVETAAGSLDAKSDSDIDDILNEEGYADSDSQSPGSGSGDALPADDSISSSEGLSDDEASKDSASKGGDSTSGSSDESSGGSDEGGSGSESMPPSDGTASSGSGTSSGYGNDSSNGGTSGSGSESGGSDGENQPSANDVRVCARLNGVSESKVHIAGKGKSNAISANSVVAVKITGNQHHLDLNLTGSAGIAGVCVFIAGNQSSTAIQVGVPLGNLIYFGRGNQSSGVVRVSEGGSIRNVLADLAGNRASLTIDSAGQANCNKVRLRGNNPSFSCK